MGAVRALHVVRPGERPKLDLPANMRDEEVVACNVVENLVASDRARVAEVMHLLTPLDFAFDPFRSMYAAALALHERGEVVTPNGVLGWMAERGFFGSPEGRMVREDILAYLRTAPEERRLETRAQRIRDLACRREALGQLRVMQAQLADVESGPTADLLVTAGDTLREIAARVEPTEAASMEAAYTRAAALAIPGAVIRLATGMRSVDEMLDGGLACGRTAILGATKGTGKSLLCGQWAVGAAMQGHGAFVLSLELPSDEYLSRLASERSAVPYRLVSRGELNGGQLYEYHQALKDLQMLPLIVRGGVFENRSFTSVRNQIARARREFASRGIQLRYVAIDYLQKITTPGGDDDQRSAMLTRCVDDLDRIAQEHTFAMMIVSQLNDDERVKWTREAEDIVALILVAKKAAVKRTGPAQPIDRFVDLRVEKARFQEDGGKVRLRFHNHILRFEDE